MINKLLTWASLITLCVNVFADGLTATLQQGEKMTPFYGVNAFVDAYQAADSGAVISLSAGHFYTIDIKKPVKIIGNFGLNFNSNELTRLSSLSIIADNVTVDGIYISDCVKIGNINNFTIIHSWINYKIYSLDGCTHTNTVVDQCVITYECAAEFGRNYTIKNSRIKSFSGNTNNPTNLMYMTNCIIDKIHATPSSEKPSVNTTESITCTLPYGIYKNNIFGSELFSYDSKWKYFTVLPTHSEFYNNIFINNDYYQRQYPTKVIEINQTSTFDNNNLFFDDDTLWKNKYFGESEFPLPEIIKSLEEKGQDGTMVGPYGGTGFSLYPDIPRITSSTIDSNTDSEGKLNVTIQVSVAQ